MIEKYVPTKTSSTKRHRPWIINELKKNNNNNKNKKQSRCKYRTWGRATTTNKANDWARFETIKKETRKLDRQAYQKFTRDITTEDTTNNILRFIKSKRYETAGMSRCKRNGLTFNESRDKAGIINDKFCNAFTREDLDDQFTL